MKTIVFIILGVVSLCIAVNNACDTKDGFPGEPDFFLTYVAHYIWPAATLRPGYFRGVEEYVKSLKENVRE